MPRWFHKCIFFENLPTPLFGNDGFVKIQHLFRFACATGYDTGGIRANGKSNASYHPAQ